jgi:hypothetical protein
MYESLADLMSDFGLVGADCLNVLLIKHDVIRSCGEVEDAPLRRRHAGRESFAPDWPMSMYSRMMVKPRAAQ